MKTSCRLFVVLLGLCTQLSQASPMSRRTVNTTTSAYLNIQDSSNSTLDNYWGYVDPNIVADNGVVFQFTPDKSKATNFSISNNHLAGYKTGYVAGSTNAEGTANGGAVYMSALDLYEQGGEPVLAAAVSSITGVVSLSDTLGDGTDRNIAQACLLTDVGYYDAGLPVLVVGEEYFDTNSCANITLYWVPVSN